MNAQDLKNFSERLFCSDNIARRGGRRSRHQGGRWSGGVGVGAGCCLWWWWWWWLWSFWPGGNGSMASGDSEVGARVMQSAPLAEAVGLWTRKWVLKTLGTRPRRASTGRRASGLWSIEQFRRITWRYCFVPFPSMNSWPFSNLTLYCSKIDFRFSANVVQHWSRSDRICTSGNSRAFLTFFQAW
jgi:hypothetical protein